MSVGLDWQAAPSKIIVGSSGPRAPTTISVPPVRERVQHGDGINIDDEEDSSTDSDQDFDEDDEISVSGVAQAQEDEIAEDLRDTLNNLKVLRKEYRQALPQLKEISGRENFR